MSIAVIGSNMMDLVTQIDRMPEEGETLQARGFTMGHGGKGANQAIAAARLGADVVMVSRVGDDAFARATLDNFQSYGIDTTHVLSSPGPSGVAPIFVDQEGRNRILIVPGANLTLTPADVDAAADALVRCRLIVLQLEVPLDTVHAAVDFGVAHDIPVLLNPAPANPDLDREKVARCDWFVPNESELALLTGRPTGTLDEVRVAAAEVAQWGAQNVLVTLGSRGAWWYHDGEGHLIEGVRVDAVDTTGAGDAFIGCFAQQLVAGVNPATAIAAANRYAADSVTRHGTQTSYADRIPGADT